MKRKKDVLKFLEDNRTMIDSLMSNEERRKFGYSVTGIIINDFKRQIEQEEKKKDERS